MVGEKSVRRSEFPRLGQVRDSFFRWAKPTWSELANPPEEVMAQCPRAGRGTADLKSGGRPYRSPILYNPRG